MSEPTASEVYRHKIAKALSCIFMGEMGGVADAVAILRDLLPAKTGWAPGAYVCECAICKSRFIGQKHSTMCQLCAYPDPLAMKGKT